MTATPPSRTTPDPGAALDWDAWSALPPREKAPLLAGPSGRLQTFVYTQQVDRPLLDRLCLVAETIRTRRHDAAFMRALRRELDTRSAALYFTQPSTRTYVSFALAARAVGLMCDEIRDPQLSSLYKGESELDTLLTLAALADAVIMRQGDASTIDRFCYEIHARGLETVVVNGGSGSDQHPTQALLEAYTLASRYDLARRDEPFTLGTVGDLKRSRTARSLAYLLALYPQVRHVFIAPPELQMEPDLLGYLDEQGVAWTQSDDLPAALPDLDAVYMMRMQDEYGDTSDDTRRAYERFRLAPELLPRLKPDACILHPLPRRDELPLEVDADPRALYWEAVDRGKFVRMALLLHQFGSDEPERIAALGR